MRSPSSRARSRGRRSRRSRWSTSTASGSNRASGSKPKETPRDVAFCSHVVASGRELIVEDAAADQRFHDNPLVEGDPNIRFYAGVPLMTPEGYAIGTLCVMDSHPRTLTSRAARGAARCRIGVDERARGPAPFSLALRRGAHRRVHDRSRDAHDALCFARRSHATRLLDQRDHRHVDLRPDARDGRSSGARVHAARPARRGDRARRRIDPPRRNPLSRRTARRRHERERRRARARHRQRPQRSARRSSARSRCCSARSTSRAT